MQTDHKSPRVEHLSDQALHQREAKNACSLAGTKQRDPMHVITNADMRALSEEMSVKTQLSDQIAAPHQEEDVVVFHSSSQLQLSAAKLRLEVADTARERQLAVSAAMELGMPLWQIEQYLDWLDFSRSCQSTVANSRSWVKEARTWMGTQFKAGAELFRRAHRRLFGSANRPMV